MLAVMLLPALCACGNDSTPAVQPAADFVSADARTVTEVTETEAEQTASETTETTQTTSDTAKTTQTTSDTAKTTQNAAKTTAVSSETAVSTTVCETTKTTVSKSTSAAKTSGTTSAVKSTGRSVSYSETETPDHKTDWSTFVLWLDTSKKSDFVFDGEFLTMQVKIAEDAKDGVYPVGIMTDDFTNYNGDRLETAKNPGFICVNAEAPEPANQSGGDLTLTGSTVSGKPGDTVTFTIGISDNKGIAGFRLWLKYDKKVLKITDVSAGKDFPGNPEKFGVADSDEFAQKREQDASE